ncbi:exopolyphosphatase [Schizosaccharomyces japonicus yFS275]|uniref:Exopolyphosphatase n=1 Tax=Schizosaccharomyces japonicus (strain yFS275 / FY16936) TaxID=402676 RepID=B6K5J0_SCHJY|nr:exopolyphosphatase [Schizosaccharomyces japonicus yFS275]EEB08794.1 exopolyphosphatase [Schizosaccharomyces japonicus yFS275]
MSFIKFLKNNGQLYKKLVTEEVVSNVTSKLILVCGNESADLDSCASSLLYAYCYQQKHEDDIVLPFFNVPKDELRLRPELSSLLKYAKIPEDYVLTLDDIQEGEDVLRNTSVHLVDHNSISRKELSFLSNNVAGIIDHHKDEGKFLDANPRIIDVTGSCSTLVAEYFLPIIQKKFEHWKAHGEKGPFPLTILALGAILVDTGNLKNAKTTDKDCHVAEELFKLVKNNFKRDDFFETLKEAKKDCDGMTFTDLIHRDLKKYYFNTITLGFPSIGKGLKWLEKHHSNWKQDLIQWAQADELDIALVGLSQGKKKEFKRQLVLFGRTSIGKEMANEFIKLYKDELQLHAVDDLTDTDISAWNQGNAAASRKKLAPMAESAANAVLQKN